MREVSPEGIRVTSLVSSTQQASTSTSTSTELILSTNH